MISKHSAHSTSLPVGFRTWLWRYTYLLLYIYTYIHTYIHTCLLISMLWHRQAIFELKRDKLSSSAECRIRTQCLWNRISSILNVCWQTNWAIEDRAKTRQPVPMISEHSAHSTPPPVGFQLNIEKAEYLRTTAWTIEDQAKTWTGQPAPVMSKHWAHLTSLSVLEHHCPLPCTYLSNSDYVRT